MKKQSKSFVVLYLVLKNTIPMLCKDKITAIFCIIDDILKEICPIEDKRRKISDSEVILTAVLAAKNFYGNHSSAIRFVKGKSEEALSLNRKLEELKTRLVNQYDHLMKIDGFATAEKLKNSFLGIGTMDDSLLKVFENFNVDFEKMVQKE